MKVAFDASTAAFRQKTGTGVYCEELIKAYQNRFPDDVIIHTYRLSRRIKGRNFLLPLPTRGHRETLVDPWTFFKGNNYDVFHGLNSRLPLLSKSKMIATIHDLFSIFGEFSDKNFRADQSKKLKQMIDRAHHIIVPATFTKKLLVDKLSINESKITVVPEGVRSIFLTSESVEASRARVTERFKIKNPYLLFVGTLEKRKNIVGLLKSFSFLRSRTPDLNLDLVLVGGPGFGYEEIEETIKNLPSKDRIKILGFVGEASLVDLYRSCEIFVFPSLEEGFGIPVIEAMACGVPVITSNTTSLPEVGQGHTWLVDPHDRLGLAEAIERILTKKTDDIQKKIQESQLYACSQTWTLVAEKTRAVYENVLSEAR